MRIELFDSEIEAIKFFDPLTGEIFREVPRVTIFPKTHYVTSKEVIANAINKIKSEMKERVSYLEANNKLVEAQRIEQRTKYDLEMMRELGLSLIHI